MCGMEFFCYHRDRPDSAALRDELLAEHWTYMDRYAAEMIARGPTLSGDTATGSVHIVDVPDPAAARAFAFDEPTTRPACTGTCCCAVAQHAGPHHVGLPRRPDRRCRYLVLGLGAGPAADLAVPQTGTS